MSARHQRRNKSQAAADLDSSLKNLRTDHVDVWLLHAKCTPQDVSDELLEHGETAKKQGKIRFFGFSTHDINQMADHAIKSKLDVIVFTYNFTMGTDKDAAIRKAYEAGIGLAAIKVMAATGGAAAFRWAGRIRGGRWTGSGRLAAGPGRELPCRRSSGCSTIRRLRRPSRHPQQRHDGHELKTMTEKLHPEDQKLLVARNEEVRPYYCRMCFQCTGQCPKRPAGSGPVADSGVRRFL